MKIKQSVVFIIGFMVVLAVAWYTHKAYVENEQAKQFLYDTWETEETYTIGKGPDKYIDCVPTVYTILGKRALRNAYYDIKNFSCHIFYISDKAEDDLKMYVDGLEEEYGFVITDEKQPAFRKHGQYFATLEKESVLENGWIRVFLYKEEDGYSMVMQQQNKEYQAIIDDAQRILRDTQQPAM